MATPLEELYRAISNAANNNQVQPQPIEPRKITPIEDFFMTLQRGGERFAQGWNKALGINTDEEGNFDILKTWGDAVNPTDEEGNFDLGKLVSTPLNVVGAAGKTVAAMPGMVMQGWGEAPEYFYSAATGSPISQEGAVDENGNVVVDNLTPEERLASAGYAIPNIIPVGFGKIGSTIGKTVLKESAEELAGQGLKGVAKKAGAEALGQSIEEGAEEAFQEVSQNVLNNRDIMTNVPESFFGGALAGGAIGGAKGAIGQAASNYQKKTNDKTSDPVQTFTQIPSFKSPYTQTQIGDWGISAVEEEQRKALEKFTIVPGATSSMGRAISKSDSDAISVGALSLSDMVESEGLGYSGYDKKITDFFKDFNFDGITGDFVQAKMHALQNGNYRQFVDAANTYIADKKSRGERLQLVVSKNPGGTLGLVRGYLDSLTYDNTIGVSQSAAFLLNADFDSDHYLVTVDNGNKYGSTEFVSTKLSDSSTYGDPKDLMHIKGLGVSSVKTIVDGLKNLKKNLIGNKKVGSMTEEEFETLATKIAYKVCKVDTEIELKGNAEIAFNNSVNSLNSLIGLIVDETTANASAKTSSINDFWNSISIFHPSNNQQTVADAVDIKQNVFDETQAKGTSKQIKWGNVESTVEAYMKFHHARLFANPSQGEYAIRENLAMYYMIKDTVRQCVIENGRNEIPEQQELLKMITKKSLGIEAYGIHPEEIASSVIRKDATRKAMEEYHAKQGKKTFDSEYDYKLFLDECLSVSYTEARKNYQEAMKRLDTKGEDVSDNASWVLAEWSDKNADRIFLSCFGDESIKNLFNIETSSFNSLQAIITQVAYNEEFFRFIHGANDVNDSINNYPAAKHIIRRLVEAERENRELAQKNLIDTIRSIADGDMRAALSSLERVDYDYTKLSFQDQVALYRYVCGLSYYSGIKDFSKAGFFTFQSFMNSSDKDMIRHLLSSDVAMVEDGLMTLSFRNKLGKLLEVLRDFANDKNESNFNAHYIKIVDELNSLAENGPLYASFASFFTNNVLEKKIAPTLESRMAVADMFKDKEGFLNSFIDVTKGDKRRENIKLIIDSCNKSSVLSDDSILYSALESKTDLLDMQSPSSRARKAKPYFDMAATMNEAYLKSKIEDTRSFVKNQSGIGDVDFERVLRYRQMKRNTEVSVDAIAYILDTSLGLSEEERDKTRSMMAALAEWEMSSTAQIGYSPTELQNLACGVVSANLISENPQLASTLFLTDYIKENGGITITFNDGSMLNIDSRNDLFNKMLNNTTLRALEENEVPTIDHWFGLCDVCPNLINIITPVSSTFSNMNGYSKISGNKTADSIEVLIKEVSTLPDFETGDEGGAVNFNDRERADIKRGKWASWFTTTAEGLSFFLAALNKQSLREKATLQEKRAYISNYLYQELIPWADIYAHENTEGKKKMVRDLLGDSFDSDIADLLDSYSNYNETLEEYLGTNMPTLRRLNETVVFAEVDSTISNAINEYLDTANAIMNDGVVPEKTQDEIRKETEEKFKEFYEGLITTIRPESTSMIKLIYSLIEPIRSESSFELLVRNKFDASISKNKQRLIERRNELQAYLDSMDPNDQSTRDEQIKTVDALAYIEQGLLACDNVTKEYINKEFRKNMFEAFTNDPKMAPVVQSVATIKSFRDRNVVSVTDVTLALRELSLYYREACRVGENEKENVVKEVKKYIKAKEKDSLRDFFSFNEFATKDEINQADIEYVTGLTCKMLGQLAESFIASNAGLDDFSTRFIGDISDVVDGFTSFISAEYDQTINDQSIGTYYKGKAPHLKIDLHDRMGIAQMGKALANTLSGNVELGVSMNSSNRVPLISYGFYGQNLHTMNRENIQPKSLKSLVDEYKSGSRFSEVFGNSSKIKELTKSLYYGAYYDGQNWIKITPFKLAQWAADESKIPTLEPVRYYTVADDNCGFDVDYMVPSANGKPYNQFLTICAKLLINSAEALNLKTKKDLRAFLRASFSNLDITDATEMKRKANISGDSLNTLKTSQDFNAGLMKAFADVKASYLKTLYVLTGQSGREKLDLSFADLKVLSDHMIQGAIIEFSDGHMDSIMLRDLMNGTLALSEEEIAGITSIRIQIEGLAELGNSLAREVSSDMMTKVTQDKSLNLDDNVAWTNSFEKVLKSRKIKGVERKNASAKLSEVFANTYTRRNIMPTRFSLLDSTKIRYEEIKTGKKLDLGLPQRDSFKEQKSKYGFNIANIITDKPWKDDYNNAIKLAKESDVENCSLSDAWLTIVDSSDEAAINTAVKQAQRNNSAICLVGVSAERFSDTLTKYGFVLDIGRRDSSKLEDLVGPNYDIYIQSSKLNDFNKRYPEAGYTVMDPNEFFVKAFVPSDMADVSDGESLLTDEGRKQIERIQASIPSYYELDLESAFGVLEVGTISRMEMVRKLGKNKTIQQEDVRKSLKLLKLDKDDLYIQKAMAAVDLFLASGNVTKLANNRTEFVTDGAVDDITCVGIVKVGSGIREVYLPIFVKSPVGSVIRATSEDNTIRASIEVPVLGRKNIYGYMGVAKSYDVPDSLKTTVIQDGTRKIGDVVLMAQGKGILPHLIDSLEYNFGKTDFDLNHFTTYSNYMWRYGLSLLFNKPTEGEKYKINKDIFGQKWEDEEILNLVFGVPGNEGYETILNKIMSGERVFGTKDNNVNNALRRIAENAKHYKFKFADAVSGINVDEVGESFFNEGIPIQSLKRNKGMWTQSLMYEGVHSSDFQDLFNLVSPEDFQGTRDLDETTECTFDKYGMVKTKEGLRVPVVMDKVTFDETMSQNQIATKTTRIGNKLQQINRFASLGGDYRSCTVEMLQSIGAYSQAENIMQQNKLEFEKPERTKEEADDYVSYLSSLMSILSPKQTAYERTRKKLYKDIRDRFEEPIKLLNEDKSKISLTAKDGSLDTYADDNLENCKNRMEQVLGMKLTRADFETLLKLGFSSLGGETEFAFYLDDINTLINSMSRSLSECGLPFDGGITVKTKNMQRFGMPILPLDLAKKLLKNSKVIKDSNSDINEFYNKMRDAFSTNMVNSLNVLSDPIQKRAIFTLASYLVEDTILEPDDVFKLTVADMTVKELLESTRDIDATLFEKELQNIPELRAAVENVERQINDIVERQRWRNTGEIRTSDGRSTLFNISRGDGSAIDIANRLCSLRQIMGVAEPMLFIASPIERTIYGNATKYLLYNGLKEKNGRSLGVYKTNLSDYLDENRRAAIVNTINSVKKRQEVVDSFGAIKSLSFVGDFDFLLEEGVRSGNIKQYLTNYYKGKSGLERAAKVLFEFASGKNIGTGSQIEAFFADLLRLISLDEVQASVWLVPDENGKTMFESKLENNPNGLILEAFSKGSGLRIIAEQAFNTAMRGDAAQRSALSVLIQEYCATYPIANLFIKTAICPFVQYGINVTGRHLNAILPVSTFNYVLTNYLSTSEMALPGLTGKNGDPLRWKDLNLESTQVVSSIEEAIKMDLVHIGATGVIALFVGLGCLEPPDDDDKWCNVDEWTFLGQRIKENWWIQDAVGPVLGIACMYKSVLMGKPNVAVMFKQVAQCMYSNPLVRSGDIINTVIDPYGEYMESYYEDLDRFSKAYDGKPNPLEVLTANTTIFGLNWFTSFCTPAIFKEVYRKANQYEVSYKRIYETDETGQLTEAGKEGQTQYTTYWDQKLRQATRKNPTLGFLADMLVPHTTGYLNSEMPRTVYYDPAQLESYKALSLYAEDEKGNQILKPEAEREAIALGIIITLQSYDDMGELAQTGFCIPYDTMKYVGDIVWSIAKGGKDLFAEYEANGLLDYYALGDGDYDEGSLIYSALNQLNNQTYSYWSDFYYNKLWSDEMKNGIARYNRYNTTYEQDANGEWYATGYRNDITSIFSPYMVAPGSLEDPGTTMGYDEDWDTMSVVTGESTGQRALIPYSERITTPKFGETSTSGTKSGSSGYGYSYGSSGGFRYSAPQNNMVVSSPYATDLGSVKIDTTDNYRSPNLDYWRPSFETQGSRKAYKREDI